ncbi:predicted protein [Scheffersomyces stipitis CBS 6054]|uniref:Uncharacterized protein n=1 Tax=Scheffersomyces stipitis (strain ATCC 58785 / CBS 6054 / NBRC 10063 / NRRL Y-11545) TaxID=322104 RepID=A3LTC1_PICST|nr:predicted protein [Scheffersomyces stipitis CBS 6054]ABN66380.1 predicted protein [Scheffersomyces stipitis CBS 6054]KAG2732873.1 hypothetical protein G9P44_003863 [Scheffersomyces stipitis]
MFRISNCSLIVQNLNRKTFLNSGTLTSLRLYSSASTPTRGRGKKGLSEPFEERNIEEYPNEFCAVHTNYGWFTVPLHYYGYDWTSNHINKLVEDSFPDIAENPRDKFVIQQKVDEWIPSVDTSIIPKSHKLTKREGQKIKKEELYRKQLKVEIEPKASKDSKSASANEKKTIASMPEESSKEVKEDIAGIVSYTQTWNYYFSLKYAKSEEPYLIARKNISQSWASLSPATKEKYRLEYAQLLLSGRDIYKGKIITIEEKEKKNQSFAKYKKTLKEKEMKRKQELIDLAEND